MKKNYLILASLTLLCSLGAGQPAFATDASVIFYTENLSLGSKGPDGPGIEVLSLQQRLNKLGFLVATSGAGSPGQETTYFGPGTRAALIKFQTSHAADLGITQGTGYFGPLTRNLLNAVIREYSPEGNSSLRIDFRVCKTDAPTIEIRYAMGHMVLKFLGLSGNNCHFQYGSELKNPSWDGKMVYDCLVPKMMRNAYISGIGQYKITDTGIDMGEFKEYCTPIK